MTGTDLEQPLFQLNPEFKDPLRRKLFPIVKAPLEKALLLNRVNSMYREIEKTLDTGLFLANITKRLSIQSRLEDKDFERIPQTGPAIAVMNHPFGGIEGILLASLLHSRRKDIKIMANYLLTSIPKLADLFIFVDPFERKEALNRNIRALREAIRWVENGGLLGIFPAGEVSHFHFNQRKILDPPWSEGIVRILKKTKAPVLPVFIKGNNGPLFHIAGLVHPRLRTALLPRELVNKQKKEIEIRIGNVISNKTLVAFPSDREMLSYLRHRTYMLEHRAPSHQNSSSNPHSFQKKKKNSNRSFPPPFPISWQRKYITCRSNKPYWSMGEYKVAYAHSAQIPYLLREIGRLRELTFRQSGEGTGKALDLDEYDTFYLHLFLWKRGYPRIDRGLSAWSDRYAIEPPRSERFVYPNSFFLSPFLFYPYPSGLGIREDPSSRIEYQKSYNALLLLWKGIGRLCRPTSHGIDFFSARSVSIRNIK